MTQILTQHSSEIEEPASYSKTASKVKTQTACLITYSDFGANTRGRKQASALMEAGYTVDCIIPRSRSDSSSWGLPADLSLHFVPIYKDRSHRQITYAVRYFLFFVLTFLIVTRLYFKQRYRYIQVATLPEFLVFTTLIPRLLGAKVVLDVCDLSSELYESKFQRPATDPLARLVRLVEKLSLNFANALLTVHEPYRQKLLERGLADRKITILLNVADETVFKRPQDLAEVVTPNQALRLVYHGTLARRNGVDLIIRALAEVKATAPTTHFKLDIYGDGDNYQEVVELINELGVTEMVNLQRGFVPVAQLPSLLAGANAGLVANRCDGFMEYTLPTKLLEYVALGIFSIVPRTITIEAYFDDTQVAFFEPEDYHGLAQRLIELAHNPRLAIEKARYAYAFYDSYNWSNTKACYQGLIAGLLGT